MYSVTKYWVKNKNLYFVTTQSEVLYAPLAQIDRVYPRVKAVNRKTRLDSADRVRSMSNRF